jgi:hypothetical protein
MLITALALIASCLALQERHHGRQPPRCRPLIIVDRASAEPDLREHLYRGNCPSISQRFGRISKGLVANQKISNLSLVIQEVPFPR